MAKILIVDDAYFVRIKLKNLLEAQGLEVIEASNGVEAIQVYQEQTPDLIFCDITMPEMDGISTLKRLKEIDADVKVVMLTSVGEQQVLMEALYSGAKNFLVKPFEEDKVLEVVKTFVAL